MAELNGKRVAILATEGFEQSELEQPRGLRLPLCERGEGAEEVEVEREKSGRLILMTVRQAF